ncbi:hypothetical protein D3C84_1042580 [compost metagenome]
MAGIDTMGFIRVTVVMRVVVIGTLLELEHPFATPGTPQHPERNQNDQCRGRELEVRLRGLGIQALSQVHATDGDQPHHRRMRKRGRQAQQHRLFDRATNGHDERRHHGL